MTQLVVFISLRHLEIRIDQISQSINEIIQNDIWQSRSRWINNHVIINRLFLRSLALLSCSLTLLLPRHNLFFLLRYCFSIRLLDFHSGGGFLRCFLILIFFLQLVCWLLVQTPFRCKVTFRVGFTSFCNCHSTFSKFFLFFDFSTSFFVQFSH